MFVSKLKQIEVERFFLPSLNQTIGFNQTESDGKDTLLFMYKNLITSYKHNLFITDFTINGVEDKDYLKFMYDIFGDEYALAYFKQKII